MTNFFHRLFNPHCPDCRADAICESCETLRIEIARLRDENTKLLDRILEKPTSPVAQEVAPMKVPPRNVPWNVRRQMLEAEDRERAKLMAQVTKTDVTDLEKELDVVEKDREHASTN
jgi:hypothetical protein